MGIIRIPIDKRNHDTRNASEARKRKVVINYKLQLKYCQS